MLCFCVLWFLVSLTRVRVTVCVHLAFEFIEGVYVCVLILSERREEDACEGGTTIFVRSSVCLYSVFLSV